MSILSGPRIEQLVNLTKATKAAGHPAPVPGIDITPFTPGHVGPNSVDLTLAGELLVYFTAANALDPYRTNLCRRLAVPEGGVELMPGVLYLGSTNEEVEAHGLVPVIETRSSLARLGVSTHLSAGFCDDGFRGTITLEITVVHPVRLYPHMRVAQVAFHTLEGERRPYSGRYQGQIGPVGSRLHFTEGTG